MIKLFSGLPRDSSASFLVTQHLSPHSASELDRILQKCTQMHVAFAQDRQLFMPDTVYLAPRDRHLMIKGNCVRITRGPKECRARPAVDVLFRSAALAFGPRVIGVILTGALDDGTAGLWQIKDRNGLAFVQDPDEAQYSSMPTSAIEHVKVDCVGSIDTLVSEIVKALATEAPLPEAPASSQRLAIETLIAFEGNGMQAGVMSLGQVSKYTCPECHGVLVQIEEGAAYASGVIQATRILRSHFLSKSMRRLTKGSGTLFGQSRNESFFYSSAQIPPKRLEKWTLPYN